MKWEDIIKYEKKRLKRLKRQKNAPPKFYLWNGQEAMAKIITHQNNIIIDIIGKHKNLSKYQIDNLKKEFVIPRNYIPEVYREKRIGNKKFEKK